MARVIPIKGLDSDLEKVVGDLKSAIERRDHLNDYIDALTQIQDIYMKIKILAGTLGFSVKEIEFSDKTISNLDILFKNSNMNEEDTKQYEIDKGNYEEKMNSAQLQVITKSQELDNQINLLLDLKESVKDNLADKDFSSIDNILKSLDMFVDALDLKKIVEKAIKDQKYTKEQKKAVEENEDEDNGDTDDFSSLNDIVSEGEMLHVKKEEKKEKEEPKKEEATPIVPEDLNISEPKEPETQEVPVIPNGKKVLSISNLNPSINSILHPVQKPVVEDNVETFAPGSPTPPVTDDTSAPAFDPLPNSSSYAIGDTVTLNANE